MPIWRIPVSREPILLLDPDLNSADELATHLELQGFPTRIERTGAAAQTAMRDAHFATLIVFADLDDKACLDCLDDLRRTAARSWLIVISPLCDARSCDLIHRHGGDACVTRPVSLDELILRLTAFQSRSRPLY
jgi:DNA-binding response OmpR family regulator